MAFLVSLSLAGISVVAVSLIKNISQESRNLGKETKFGFLPVFLRSLDVPVVIFLIHKSNFILRICVGLADALGHDFPDRFHALGCGISVNDGGAVARNFSGRK